MSTAEQCQYDSDSELNASDRLQFDDSDDDEPSLALGSTSAPVVVATEISSTDDVPFSEPTESEPCNEHDTSEESKIVLRLQSDDENPVPAIRRKKISNLIDSDSDEEQATATPTTVAQNVPDVVSKEIGTNRFQELLDSDTSDDEQKPRKKQRKKKTTKAPVKANDILASLNLDFSDDDDESVRRRDSDTGDDPQSSGEESDPSEHSKQTIKKGRFGKSRKNVSTTVLANHNNESNDEESLQIDTERNDEMEHDDNSKATPQRLSAKQAMEQMKEIQSESQRMAREAHISVPYHRPKEHTLQEFLARKTIFRPSPTVSGTVRRSAAAAIKMTPDELEAYAKQLSEREQESMEFYKSETDEEDDTEEVKMVEITPVEQVAKITEKEVEVGKMDVNETESVGTTEEKSVATEDNVETVVASPTVTSEPKEDMIDALVNQTSDTIEQLRMTAPTKSVAGPINYDLFWEPSAETPPTKRTTLLATKDLPACPKLSGSADMLIDLETGDLEPRAPSGADILFQRFAKCSGKKSQKPTNVSIVSTEKGVVELTTHALTEADQQLTMSQKDPIPGAAFVKLKQTLKERIEQNRRESFKKRQEEVEKLRKLDNEEDEEMLEDEEDILEDVEDEEDDVDDDMEDEDLVEDDVPMRDKKRVKCDLLDDEAEDEDVDAIGDVDDDQDDDGDDPNDSDNNSSSEDETTDCTNQKDKQKRRIIAAFEDSEDEGEDVKQDAGILKKLDTEEFLSSFNDSDKFTLSGRNDQENEEEINLLWKDSEENVKEDELMELCSGQFVTQPPAGTSDTQVPMTPLPAESLPCTLSTQIPDAQPSDLFTQGTVDVMGDSQLMALCSGRFETQVDALPETNEADSTNATEEPRQNEPDIPVPPTETVVKGKLVLDSSEDELEGNQEVPKKRKKRKQRKRANISDDDDSDEEGNEINEVRDGVDQEDEDEDEAEENEEGEKFIDYDSEENEVEVMLTKKDKKKLLANFVENEAELSESEWGSADEDEKDLDRYDAEQGDEEQFDQNKLKRELEKIHMRQVLDQDNREVKQLQNYFIDDEENDGVGRTRHFRWKNVEQGFSLDYARPGVDTAIEGDGAGSDDENEEQWRKMRHERQVLLEQNNINTDDVDMSVALLEQATQIDADKEQENDSATFNVSLVSKRKVTVVRKSATAIQPKSDSTFLISKSAVVQEGHKASFLARDGETLNRLANLVKSNMDIEGGSLVTAGNARNFVFASLTPAPEKAPKRSLDDVDEIGATKKQKPNGGSPGSNTKKRLLLDQLM